MIIIMVYILSYILLKLTNLTNLTNIYKEYLKNILKFTYSRITNAF